MKKFTFQFIKINVALIILFLSNNTQTFASDPKSNKCDTPVVNLGPALQICTSDTIVLNAGNPGSTYLWSTGDTTQTIRVSDSATYSVKVTNPTTGCFGTDFVKISNLETPVSTFIVQSTNGQNVTFSPTVIVSGVQYSWNFDDPNSSSNHSLLASPTHYFTSWSSMYNVSLTVTKVSTDCKSTSVVLVYFESVGGNFAELFKFKASPNPFTLESHISYTLPQYADKVSLEVYDMLGRKVSTLFDGNAQDKGEYKHQFTSNSELNSGVYVVRLTVDGKAVNIRIVDVTRK